MWEKLTSMSTTDLTIIGICILAINLVLVIAITIVVTKKAKVKEVASVAPKRSGVRPNANVYVTQNLAPHRVPMSLNILGAKGDMTTDYKYGTNWVGADIESSSYRGATPPVKAMPQMLDFGYGENLRVKEDEYDPSTFIDGSTFSGKCFKARRKKRIEKRVPMHDAYGKKVALGTIVPKYQW